MKKGAFGILLVGTIVLSACGATQSQAVVVEEPPVPVEETGPEADAASGEDVQEEALAAEVVEEQAADEPVAEAPVVEEAEASAPAASPNWHNIELTDVNSGQTFSIADFQGKVVLIETMAVWCPFCTDQQRQTQALHGQLGDLDDLVSLSLDIDPNESADILKAHAERFGFNWRYAVVPPEVAREIGQLYGAQYLNPPATPMLIIDRQGQAHTLPFGLKSAGSLQEALAPFLNEG